MRMGMRLFLSGFLGGAIGCSGTLPDPTSSVALGTPAPGSPWMGMNISADIPYADITNQLNAFEIPENLKDAQGYPLPGISAISETDIGAVLPSGMYKISYRGTGSLQVSGIGTLAGPWTIVNEEQRNVVQIVGTPGEFGRLLVLSIQNGPGQSVHDLHLLYPDFDYGTTQIFMPGFLAILRPFRSMRFMNWMRGDDVAELTDWSQAPSTARFGKSNFGEYYSNILALVNETGKDAWINIPPNATDDFVRQLADFFRDGLDFQRIERGRNSQSFSTPFQLIVEYGNEVWAGGDDYYTLLAAANSNPQLFDGNYTGAYGPGWMADCLDCMRIGQASADKVVQIGNIFRQEFATIGRSDVIAPVLPGWALGAAYSDVGLRFISEHYGEPRRYVSYVAIGPYFGVDDDSQTGDLDSLFAALGQSIQGVDASLSQFRTLVDEYGIQISAYEGGQNIDGIENLHVKHLAQYDRRMYSAYVEYLAVWRTHFGQSMFTHYGLTAVPGIPEEYFQYGFWGSIDSVLDDPTTCGQNLPQLDGNEDIADVRDRYCPKYEALREQAAPH